MGKYAYVKIEYYIISQFYELLKNIDKIPRSVVERGILAIL